MCEHQGQSLNHNMMTNILNSTTGDLSDQIRYMRWKSKYVFKLD